MTICANLCNPGRFVGDMWLYVEGVRRYDMFFYQRMSRVMTVNLERHCNCLGVVVLYGLLGRPVRRAMELHTWAEST